MRNYYNADMDQLNTEICFTDGCLHFIIVFKLPQVKYRDSSPASLMGTKQDCIINKIKEKSEAITNYLYQAITGKFGKDLIMN